MLAIKYIAKNKKPHSAKLNINLHPSSAQLGPPARVRLIASIRPKYSTCVWKGIPHPESCAISSTDIF